VRVGWRVTGDGRRATGEDESRKRGRRRTRTRREG
jgi:hypothetical protein